MKKVFLGFIAILLTLPPFLIGSVHTKVQISISLLTAIFAVSVLIYQRFKRSHTRWVYFDGWCLLFLLAVCMTAFQCLPLPEGLLAFLSPEAHKTFTELLKPIGMYGAGHSNSLTLAPGDTAARLIQDIASFLFFFGVLQYTRSSDRLMKICQITVCIAAALCILTYVQTLLGMSSPLMGLYQPESPRYQILKGIPFINPNHFGGYLVFHVFVAAGLLLEESKPRPKLLWGLAIALFTVGIFLSLSRGAIAVYVVGIVGLIWIIATDALQKESGEVIEKEKILEEEEQEKRSKIKYRRTRRKRGESRDRSLQGTILNIWKKPSLRHLTIVLILGLGVAMFLVSDEVKKEFTQTELSVKKDKIAVIIDFSIPILKQYPYTGVGKGALPIAWSRFATPDMLRNAQVTATHVENLILQPMVDWGVIFGLFFCLMGAWLLWSLWANAGNLFEKVIAFSIIAVLVQNLGDFNIEFMGTLFPILAVMAGLKRLQIIRGERKTYSFTLPLVIVPLLLSSYFVLIPYAMKHNYRQVKSDWRQMAQHPPKKLKKEVKEWLAHHPSDFMVPLYVGMYYSQKKYWKPKQALQWLEKASFLNPYSASIFWTRGRIYTELGLIYTAAFHFDRAIQLKSNLIRPTVAWFKKKGLLKKFVQESLSADLTRAVLKELLLTDKTMTLELSKTIRKKILKKFPKDKDLYKILTNYYFGLFAKAYYKKSPQAPMLKKELTSFLEKMRSQFEDSKVFYYLINGYIASTTQNWQKAQNFYDYVWKYGNKHTRWLAVPKIFQMHIRLKKSEHAERFLNKAFGIFTENNYLAHLSYLKGVLWTHRKNHNKALGFHEEAVRRNGSRIYWIALANACVKVYSYKRALRLYRWLYQRKPEPWLKIRIKKVQKEMKRPKSPI